MAHPGQIVQTLRLARGWTQQTLAEKAGVSDMTISKIERNETSGRQRTLLGIARALEITPDKLIMPERPSPQDEREDEELRARLLTLWDAVQPEHRAAALQALQIVVGWSAEIQHLRAELQIFADANRPGRRTSPRAAMKAAPGSTAVRTSERRRQGRQRAG